jgi:hypothetical protein
MNEARHLTTAEELVEEVRAWRRQVFSEVGTKYRDLRELGDYCPPGFRRLEGVRPMTPLSVQLAEREESGQPEDHSAGDDEENER